MSAILTGIQMNNATVTPPGRGRKQLLLLIAVFFAPLAVAFLLYYGLDGWRPVGNTNHGELIHPARPLPQVQLLTDSDATFVSRQFLDKWTLVYVGDGRCDATCRAALVLMRQTRLALNDDAARIQRLLLVTGNCCDRAYLQTEHEGLLVARVDDAAGQQLLASFPPGPAGKIYIVDPLGNLMMSYTPQALSRGLLEDLKKLLKLSHIG